MLSTLQTSSPMQKLRRRAMQFVVAKFEEVAKTERFHKLVGTSVYYAIISAVYQVVKATLN
jgi:hypothetical protein